MQTSAYEVKNNSYLFERLFKVKKNGVFLFGISFFVLEIFMFLYYANEESDDVIGGSSKTAQYSIENIHQISPFATFSSGTEGLARNTHGSYIVLTIRIRLAGVDDPCLR